jgi:hypothetical protein
MFKDKQSSPDKKFKFLWLNLEISFLVLGENVRTGINIKNDFSPDYKPLQSYSWKVAWVIRKDLDSSKCFASQATSYGVDTWPWYWRLLTYHRLQIYFSKLTNQNNYMVVAYARVKHIPMEKTSLLCLVPSYKTGLALRSFRSGKSRTI